MLIWLPLRHSRWLYALRSLQYGCAVLAVGHIDWPVAVRIAVLLLIALHARRVAPQPEALLFDQYGVQLFFAGQRVPVRLGAQCHCNEFLVLLPLEFEQEALEGELRGGAAGRKRWLLLLPDSSDADALRKLRVYLRWHAQIDPG